MDDLAQIRIICPTIREVESACDANRRIEETQQHALDATSPEDIGRFITVTSDDAKETAMYWQSLFNEIQVGDNQEPGAELETYIAAYHEALGRSRRAHGDAEQVAASLRPPGVEGDDSYAGAQQAKPSRVDLLLMIRELQRQAGVLEDSEEMLHDKLRRMDGASAECTDKMKHAADKVHAALKASESCRHKLDDKNARINEQIRNDEEASHNALTDKGRARIDAEDKIRAALDAVRKYEAQSKRECKTKLTVQQNEHFYPHAQERIQKALDQCQRTRETLTEIERDLATMQRSDEDSQKLARDTIEQTVDDVRLVAFGKQTKVEHVAMSVHAQLVREGEMSERKQAKCVHALKTARVKCAEQESGIGKRELMREIQYLRDEQENEKQTRENLDDELREWESVFATASDKKERITDNVPGCPPQYDEENAKAEQWAKKMHTAEINAIELSRMSLEDPPATASGADHALLLQRLAAVERQLEQKPQQQSAVEETDSVSSYVNVATPPDQRMHTLEARIRCLELSGKNTEVSLPTPKDLGA